MTEHPDLNSTVTVGLKQAYCWCEESLQNYFAAAGLPRISKAKMMLLVNIANQVTRPSDVAKGLRITRQAVQQTLSELEQNGFISLNPDPSDGRAKVIQFTARGKTVAMTARAAMQMVDAELAKRLGSKKSEFLREILNQDWGPPLADSG